MSDQERYADRFSAEVDRILEQQERAEEGGPPPEYGEMLALAERLAALDFSRDNPLQPRLRQRLLKCLEAERSAVPQRAPWWRRLIPPIPRRALGALVALMAVVVLVGWTPAGRAVAQAVEQFILELRWPHTTVQKVSSGQRPTAAPDDQELFEAQLTIGRAWELRFEGYEFGGCCYDKPVRDEIVALHQALDGAGFDLMLPSVLPDGYVLSEVRLLGVAPYDVFVIYEGPAGRLGLYQSMVGITSEEQKTETVVVVETRKMGVITDRALEEVMVGQTQAALTDGESLTWEQSGISFRLIGPGLDAATLVQIAESLAPVR
jgi:hypothetical protein